MSSVVQFKKIAETRRMLKAKAMKDESMIESKIVRMNGARFEEGRELLEHVIWRVPFEVVMKRCE